MGARRAGRPLDSLGEDALAAVGKVAHRRLAAFLRVGQDDRVGRVRNGHAGRARVDVLTQRRAQRLFPVKSPSLPQLQMS